MNTSAIERRRSDKIQIGEVGIRTKLMEIAATLSDVIALGRGDPDLDTPDHVIEAAKRAMETRQTHYTHIRGTIELRRAVADKLKRENNLEYNPENEILVTVGAEEAVFLSLFGLLNPGDEVLVPSPRYSSYDEAVHMWGGRINVVPTRQEDDFNFTAEAIRKSITPNTKILSLVNPGNPIGILSPDELHAIAKVVLDHDLIVISDEIYEKFIFDGTPHLSMAAIPGMRQRTITVNGPSKTYAMTGWRCGYLAAPAPFCEMLTEPAHTISICCPSITQAAAIAALTGPQDVVEKSRQIYNERRLYMSDQLDQMGLSYIPPRAGFYLFTDVTSLGMTPDEFCTRLLKEAGVLIFPGRLFNDETNRYVRLSLLAPTERIKVAAGRMKDFIAKL